MRKSFIIGLITLLPVIVTYIIIAFLLGLITAPFEYVVRLSLIKTGVFSDGLGVFTHEQIIKFFSTIFIVAFLICFIFLVGFFAARVVFHPLGHFIDGLMQKIPVVRSIYNPSKQLVNAFFKPQEEVERQAVLVPYPSKEQRTVAIVTGEFEADFGSDQKQQYVSVLVPSTPNATGGFLCSFPKRVVEPFNMPADEALKYIMRFASAKKE